MTNHRYEPTPEGDRRYATLVTCPTQGFVFHVVALGGERFHYEVCDADDNHLRDFVWDGTSHSGVTRAARAFWDKVHGRA